MFLIHKLAQKYLIVTQLDQPLHVVGYYLNPALYYENLNVENDDEVMSGLMSCIHKLALNEDEEMKIHAKLPIYRSAQGIFGNPIAKKMRVKIAPVEWWMQYGASAPTLKNFAVKALSLTCSSSGCERNWSVFEHLHSKMRNRLEQQKLNDLVYIKYNRALRRRYNMRDTIDPIILDYGNVLDPTEWLMGGEEEEEDAPVFEGENLTWGQVADAVGACEPPYSTTSRNRGAIDKSASSSRGRCLIDEDDDNNLGEEENDVAAYKDFEPSPIQDDDDEPVYEDLDDL
uniref:HAT C-terminal dimerisation domain-containing protein n=1 Tax=Lactuca sativa TaxID=4236 RepID=A0A9R1V2X0_LACSA|nr:hypothetical protein LSAT_V11C700367210 [Lactuca sativa]